VKGGEENKAIAKKMKKCCTTVGRDWVKKAGHAVVRGGKDANPY